MVRVYIKHSEDYAPVRAVCEQRLGAVPAAYVVADVCRPDLLVEIEGMAFSRWDLAGTCATPRRRCTGGTLSCRGAEKAGECVPSCPDGCPELLLCPHAVVPEPRLMRPNGDPSDLLS